MKNYSDSTTQNEVEMISRQQRVRLHSFIHYVLSQLCARTCLPSSSCCCFRISIICCSTFELSWSGAWKAAFSASPECSRHSGLVLPKYRKVCNRTTIFKAFKRWFIWHSTKWLDV